MTTLDFDRATTKMKTTTTTTTSPFDPAVAATPPVRGGVHGNYGDGEATPKIRNAL